MFGIVYPISSRWCYIRKELFDEFYFICFFYYSMIYLLLYNYCNQGPHSDFAGPTSGSTACVAIIRNNQLVVANAGDSRCVISRKGQVSDRKFLRDFFKHVLLAQLWEGNSFFFFFFLLVLEKTVDTKPNDFCTIGS